METKPKKNLLLIALTIIFAIIAIVSVAGSIYYTQNFTRSQATIEAHQIAEEKLVQTERLLPLMNMEEKNQFNYLKNLSSVAYSANDASSLLKIEPALNTLETQMIARYTTGITEFIFNLVLPEGMSQAQSDEFTKLKNNINTFIETQDLTKIPNIILNVFNLREVFQKVIDNLVALTQPIK